VVTDRLGSGESVADELQAQHLDAEFMPLDVTVRRDWDRVVAAVRTKI
jgi:hypothetical protein